MRKSYKAIALFVAMAAAMTAFASCSSGGNSSTASTGGNTTSTTESTGGEESTGGSTGEVVNLSWYQIGGQPNDLDMVTEALNEYSAEKIGVTCEFTYLDWGVWGERVKAIIQAGEPFDIMFNNSDVYTNAVDLGRFAKLDDILSEVPELEEFVPDLAWQGVTYKDGIYGVPTYKDNTQTQYWVWDKNIIEQYDIPYEEIHTLAEMDPYIRQIQDEINAGNITTSQYAFNMTRDGINGQFMNYDAQYAGLGVRYDDETATVVRMYEQPDMQEQFTYLHQWYQDGIINPDAATLTEGPSYVIVGSAQGFPGAEVGWGAGRGVDVVIEPWGGPVWSNGTIQGSINSISSSSEHQVEALKYLELVNMDEYMRNTLVYGIEGVHYTNNGDGTITQDEVKRSDYSPAGYAQATFMTMYPVAPNPATMYDPDLIEWNNSGEESVLLGFNFDRTSVQNQITACNVVTSTYNYELWTGTSDPAVIIPQMYAELEAAGMNDIQEELQRQINEYLGK